MRKLLLILLILSPCFLMAQKGTIIPDVKPQPSVTVPNDTKIWTIEDYLLNCTDSTSKCYLVKENGINKTVPVNDVFDFTFEEGNKYTVWVKEELKKPPINAYAGLYNYRVIKIVSGKQKNMEIPVVTKAELQKDAASVAVETQVQSTTPDKQVYYTTKPNPTEELLSNDVADLKKQIRDLKKQVEIMQLQMDMQLKLMDKK